MRWDTEIHFLRKDTFLQLHTRRSDEKRDGCAQFRQQEILLTNDEQIAIQTNKALLLGWV